MQPSLNIFFPHGLNLLRFLFLDSHERMACYSSCIVFHSVLIFVSISTSCCCWSFFCSFIYLFLELVCRLATMSASAVLRSYEVCALVCMHCVAIFIAMNRLLRYLMVANACHIRISPIWLFVFDQCLVFYYFFFLLQYHAQGLRFKHKYRQHTIHNSILIAGDERISYARTSYALCSHLQIYRNIITQYAIKYLCLIRTSHSRITSSVFTLNARFVSVLSLSLSLSLLPAVKLNVCTRIQMVIIITSWCAASFYYLYE